MLGAAVEPGARIALVAGGAAGAVARPDPGPIVCACFAVGLGTLRRAIVDRRLASLAAIGEALRAGTNCGSCLPELRATLRSACTDNDEQAMGNPGDSPRPGEAMGAC